MNYLNYYKLALQEAYGGEFPEMSSEEFDRRCALPQVPEALKALYLALGRTRICGMHALIPPPEELRSDGYLVQITNALAISSEDLHEENPLVHTVTDYEEDAEGFVIVGYGHDGKARIALQLANLIAASAEETMNVRASARTGNLNRFRNYFTWLTRKRLRLFTLAILVIFYVLCQMLIFTKPNKMNPQLEALSILFLSAGALILFGILFRIYCYWNVWLDRQDNVRFAAADDPLFGLIGSLTMAHLQWNHPEIWFGSSPKNFRWHPAVSLRWGEHRYCQSRYEFISDSAGEINFPGFAPIHYDAGKARSLLLRTTLGDDGSLHFTHVEVGRKWKLPKSRRMKLLDPVANTKIENIKFQLEPQEQVPVPLQTLLKQKCAENPMIRKAWLCPAIIEGIQVYLLTILAPEKVNLGPLLEEALPISDRPFNALTKHEESNVENYPPFYSRDNTENASKEKQ